MTEREPADLWRLITLKYALAIALVAALVTAAWYVTIALQEEQSVTAKIVNLSGRQRMLSQRIVLISEWRLAEARVEGVTNRDVALVAAIDLFEETHAALAHGDEGLGVPADFSEEALAIIFAGENPLDGRISAFVGQARQLLQTPNDQSALAQLRASAAGPLLRDLDSVVSAFEREGVRRVTFMDRLHTVVWAITLLVLTLEVLFIFRPLARAVAAAAEAERTLMGRRRRLFAHLAHDLRTPINVIVGYVEALRDGSFGALANDGQNRCADGIATAARYQLAMSHNLGALAKLNVLDRGAAERHPLDAAALLRECAAMMEQEAAAAGRSVAVLADRETRIEGEVYLLRRCVMNLLSNALRYGRGTVVRLLVDAQDDGGVALTVIDGSNDAASAEPGSSKPFDRFSGVAKDGLGVGLSVCVDAMEAHDGRLELYRNAWDGITARLVFPSDRVTSI